VTVIVGASAHGSPGVTTMLEILAALSPASTVLVEAAADGGSLAARHTMALAPGMLGLSEALRRGESPDILDHAQRLPSGVPAVMISPSVMAARGQLGVAGAELGSYLGQQPHQVFVDAGRVRPEGVGESLLASADQVLWLVRPLREEVAHLVTRLKELPAHAAMVVAVGSDPYRPAEIAEVAGTHVASIAFDEKGAAAFRLGGQDRRLKRSQLARSLRTLGETHLDFATSHATTELVGS